MASKRPSANDDGRWLSIADAADYLGVSTKTIRRWIRFGGVRAELRPGPTRSQYFVPVKDLDERRPNRNPTVSEIVLRLTDRLSAWEESLAALPAESRALDRLERQFAALSQALQRRDSLIAASVLLLQAVLGAESTQTHELPRGMDPPPRGEKEPSDGATTLSGGHGRGADSRQRGAQPEPVIGREPDDGPDFRHDLRLSLTLISGYARLLASEEAKARPRRELMSAYVAALRDQCDQLDQLLDLLNQDPDSDGSAAVE